MKILQVVTYISPDGAYGGPVRVAINQAKALTELGHDVLVAAASGGFKGPLPTEFDGFPVRLFPARKVIPNSGFAGLTSPGLLHWLSRAMRGADVVHVHLARDLVTLPSALLTLLANKPLVVQTHGMIDRTDNPLAVPLDWFLTRRVLGTARTVLYLTERERQDLRDVAGQHLVLRHLPNGVDLSADDVAERAVDTGTVAEVLYLARLHSRKRPKAFVEAAKVLLNSGISASFKLVGPDEGEASEVQHTIEESGFSDHITYEGFLGPGETQARLKECDIYVLPSVDEPFPMSVIEAMAAGKPVVITDTCGLSEQIVAADAGFVVDGSGSALAESIRELVNNGPLRSKMGAAARGLVERQFDLRRIGADLDTLYRDVLREGQEAGAQLEPVR
ncbi:glycosyltransferase [uncultured Kocuria sp.]|uniref:glycosyltransferase n=1 Tax=uncultured Kocuria sp. TaxID=259305 RepID=UPI002609BDA6|nr:glycosyltransferase [uncultured Kocuria sp.]